MQNVQDELIVVQEKSTEEFKDFVYPQMESMCNIQLSLELQTPRHSPTQTMRRNLPVDDISEYYRTGIFNEFLDFLNSELSHCFNDLTSQAIQALALLPGNIELLTSDCIL